jgi:hypothetical protein
MKKLGIILLLISAMLVNFTFANPFKTNSNDIDKSVGATQSIEVDSFEQDASEPKNNNPFNRIENLPSQSSVSSVVNDIGSTTVSIVHTVVMLFIAIIFVITIIILIILLTKRKK